MLGGTEGSALIQATAFHMSSQFVFFMTFFHFEKWPSVAVSLSSLLLLLGLGSILDLLRITAQTCLSVP